MSTKPQSKQAASSDELALEIVRVFNAPRHLVYATWTDPVHSTKWGPQDMRIIHCEGDLRPGGKIRVGMRHDSGEEHWQVGEYVEIVENELLVFTHAWDDGQGGTSLETLVRVEFEDAGPGRTRMIFRQTGFASAPIRDGHREGWTQAFDSMEGYLITLKTHQ